MRWSRYDVGRYHIHASVYLHAFMNAANMLLINIPVIPYKILLGKTWQEFGTDVCQDF